jgi:exportin-7
MERLPSICRYQYEAVGRYLVSLLDPALQQYREALGALSTDQSQAVRSRIEVLEGQLAWLVYVVGAIISGHSWASSQHREGDELVDGDLSRRVLQLMQVGMYI